MRLSFQTPEDLQRKLAVEFVGEDGIDAGGLSRCDLIPLLLVTVPETDLRNDFSLTAANSST